MGVTDARIAIVGAGYMAQEHARAFASLPGVRIVGVRGRSPARAKALADTYGARVYDSIDAMYRDTKADIVIVAVSELSMAEVCSSCFEHPWLCLLEKPVGIDLPQANAILAEAQRQDARCFVALNRRAYSATRQALAELSTDDGPRLISVLDQQDMPAMRAAGVPEEVVQNFMYANSIHLVDYFAVFSRGDMLNVDVVAPWTPENPRFVVARIHYSSGDVGVYQAIWDGPGPWSVAVTNRQLRAELRPLERLSVQLRGERRAIERTIDPIDTDFKPGLRFQAEQVLGALDGRSASLATLRDATRSMSLCASIYGLA